MWFRERETDTIIMAILVPAPRRTTSTHMPNRYPMKPSRGE